MKTTTFVIALTIGLSLSALPGFAQDTPEPEPEFVRPPAVQAAVDVAVTASDEMLAAYDAELAQLLAEVEALKAQVEQLRQERDAAVAATATTRGTTIEEAIEALNQLIQNQ